MRRVHRVEAGFGLLLLLLAAGLTGCRVGSRVGSLSRFEFQQPHMGTLFTITLYAPDAAGARVAADAAFAKVGALDRMMTDYDSESELMQLGRRAVGTPIPVSGELFEVLEKSQRVAELSDGAFDATVGPLVRLWRRTRRAGVLPPPEALARAREAVGWRKLKLDARNKTVTLTVANMQLDLGGIAKGYAADKALGVLKLHGHPRALVAASGDIAAGDPPPGKRGWRVAVGAPVSDAARSNPDQQRAGSESGAPFARTLLLKHAAVSTSGDTEQYVEIAGKRYSHIVDPRTGVGLTEHLQVSVIARRATDTDAFATAVSVLGVERGLKLVESRAGTAALILQQDGDRISTVESSRIGRIPQVRSEAGR